MRREIRERRQAKRLRQREARRRRQVERSGNCLYYGTAGAGAELILENGLIPMSRGLLLHEDFFDAGKQALAATAALYRDGSEDARGLVVTVEVDNGKLTRDSDRPACWRSHEPIPVEAILRLTMSDESEELADPETVNALAEQVRQEEPDLAAIEREEL